MYTKEFLHSMPQTVWEYTTKIRSFPLLRYTQQNLWNQCSLHSNQNWKFRVSRCLLLPEKIVFVAFFLSFCSNLHDVSCSSEDSLKKRHLWGTLSWRKKGSGKWNLTRALEFKQPICFQNIHKLEQLLVFPN